VKTNFYRIAIMGALTMDPRITTVAQLRAATDRVLTKPTDDPTVSVLVRAVGREQAVMQDLLRHLLEAVPALPESVRDAAEVSMDRAWVALQFLVAEENGTPIVCADCGHAIERATDATVRWIGDDTRDEREILHAHADFCITDTVRDVA